jgi:hypothetical protein
MGDFNEWWLWGRPLRAIKAIFGHTPALPTFPSFRPALALDRIWIRHTGRLKSIAVHRTRLSARASDHLPLKAVVEWHSNEETLETGATTDQSTGGLGDHFSSAESCTLVATE